jgi:hypothetical protein
VTLRRIRAYSIITAAVLWTMWLVDVSTPGAIDRLGKIKGTDFLQFYVGGSFVRDGRLQDFYDVNAQYARAQAVAPASRDTLYLPIQSPQTALVFAPLSALPYGVAVGIWLAVIVLLYLTACWLIWRRCDALRRYRAEVIACVVAFPGLYSTVLHGQTSAVALLFVTAALIALWREHRMAGGLALGCLLFKPHWLAATIAVFVVAREWRVVAGMLASAAVQLGVTYAAAGAAAMNGYWKILLSVQRIGDLLEPRPGDSLKSFFKVFVPSEPAALVLYVAASCVVLLITARVWRSDTRFELRASAVVIGTILISPHAFAYDLILLAPVYLLLANWLAEAPADPRTSIMAWSLCALFVAPLLAAVPAPIRLQFSVTAMATVLVWIRKVSDATAIQTRPLTGESSARQPMPSTTR